MFYGDDDFDDYSNYGPDRTKVWITREGNEIPIKDLSLGHLTNILAMLERNAAKVAPEVKVEVVFPSYPYLKAELKKRMQEIREQRKTDQSAARSDIDQRFALLETEEKENS